MRAVSSSLPAILACALSCAASSARALPEFRQYFPNSTVIDGNGCVNCHVNAGGGGSLNPFGAAIVSANFDWASVCHADSDGDGQTNGQELGDPDCVWTQGANPARTTAISNPGDATSTSSNPHGGSTHAGEGEGSAGEGEGTAGEGEGGAGEGEGEGEGAATTPTPVAHGCAASEAAPVGALGLVVLVAPRRRSAQRRRVPPARVVG